MGPIDPFATLGVPRRFGLDVEATEQRHRELSRALHPDKHVGTTPAERRSALTKAIEVNEAWRTLRNPITRAEALLRLEGLSSEVGETREPRPSGEFLMEVMQAREALEEARARKDSPRVLQVLAEARAQYEAVEARLASAVDAPLEAGATGAGASDALRGAIPLLGELRYAARFLEEAKLAEYELSGN